MSDILAIVDQEESDEQLIAELSRRHPDRVIVLVEGGDEELDSRDATQNRARSARISRLLSAIEQTSGAVVVGLAGSREQLLGWRFDRVIGGRSAGTGVGGSLTAH